MIGAHARVGSCDHTLDPALTAAEEQTVIKNNAICEEDNAIAANDVQLDRAGFWLLRDCDHFGQYVYIVKETTGSDVAWFSLCEVEVWGLTSKFLFCSP